jgi:hypothetical protein
MTRSRFLTLALVGVLLIGAVGCNGGGGTAGGGDSKTGEVPKALAGDDASAVELKLTDEGGGVGVASGDAYAAVYVPPGAAEAGATWTVTPLTEAPAGVEYPLCPGVYVDTAGDDPTDWCSIGFSLPGTASPNATIVKLADDGTVAEAIATTRMDYGDRTFLTAYVDGFSAYTTSEEDAAARDQAFVDRAKTKGQEVDWTIKVVGTETQENQGWTFNYEFDLFASGGDVGKGGVYKGYATLYVTGHYDMPASIVTGFGDISGTARDDNLTFNIIDAPLASLLTGQPIEDPIIVGQGTMNGSGLASLNIEASAPDVSGQYDSGQVEGSSPMPFTFEIVGEDVEIEIDNVGIFPGKILRTTK